MSSAQPITIASTSKASTGTASSPVPVSSLYGSLSRLSLGMSPSMAFKMSGSSSIDMEHGSLIKTIRGQDVGLLSEEMCRDYTCCGLPLKDLHALVDHFEEAHVVVVDSAAPLPVSSPAFSAGGFDLDDDMDLDEPVASTSTLSATTFGPQSVLVHRNSTWNTASFSPYPTPRNTLRHHRDYTVDASDCVVPELLCSPSATPSPTASRDGSPEPVSARRASPDSSGDDCPTPPMRSQHRVFMTRAAGAIQASDLPPPRPKPFKCPKPGCSKAYKQSNGLKYHLTQGQCNFAPLDPNSDELKPYICQAGCGKRFKNMSGLRYHYLHSTHGEEGLSLLEEGRHP